MVRLIRSDVIDTGTSNRQSPQLAHGQLRKLSPRGQCQWCFLRCIDVLTEQERHWTTSLGARTHDKPTTQVARSMQVDCKMSWLRPGSPPAPFCSRSQAVTGPKCETGVLLLTMAQGGGEKNCTNSHRNNFFCGCWCDFFSPPPYGTELVDLYYYYFHGRYTWRHNSVLTAVKHGIEAFWALPATQEAVKATIAASKSRFIKFVRPGYDSSSSSDTVVSRRPLSSESILLQGDDWQLFPTSDPNSSSFHQLQK